MGLSSFLNKVGDMFVPKEIAPYLGMIAPMVAPQLGILGSMALSQAGSIKMHGGKLDPYSAAATAISLGSPQARAIRRAGQVDPTRGTIGQRLSAGFAQSMPGTASGEMTAFQRALDPRVSIAKNDFGNYFENQFLAESQKGALNNNLMSNPFKSSDLNKDGKLMSKTKFDELSQGEYDRLYGDFMTQADVEKKLMAEDVKAGTAPGKGKYDKFQEMSLQDQEAYIQSFGRSGGSINSTLAGKAGEISSNLAGAIFPGFGKYDAVTGRMIGEFDFGKALQTVSIAGTVGSLKAIGEELKKQKQLDEAKQKEIWSTYFDSYLRTTGRTYDQSPYADPTLLEKYNRFMLASGGRVGYNMGGLTEGIMGSSGVPQGMQVDGRNGAFIPMGVEEKADDVPAMLSKNEFVMTADAVKAAGDGDANKGAQRMYDLMHNLEAQV